MSLPLKVVGMKNERMLPSRLTALACEWWLDWQGLGG